VKGGEGGVGGGGGGGGGVAGGGGWGVVGVVTKKKRNTLFEAKSDWFNEGGGVMQTNQIFRHRLRRLPFVNTNLFLRTMYFPSH